MPWDSVQQAKWGHTPAGEKALGGKAKVAEWDAATPKGSLPKRAPKKFADGGPTMPMTPSRGTFTTPPADAGPAVPAASAPSRGTFVTPPSAEGRAVPAASRAGRGTFARPGNAPSAGPGAMTPNRWPMTKGAGAQPASFAAGGPVLGRSISFTKDEFTGGRMPPKQSAPVKQDYAGGKPKGADKSEKAVTPRK